MLQLVIGNKNYSSWSMRAWMLLRFSQIRFTESSIDLYTPASRSQVLALGGETGLVPVLIVGGYAICDTLAITEYLYEQCPAIWPADPLLRGRARSYAGEVHSGLNAIRAAMPCNTRARGRLANRSPEVETEIARISEIWARADENWLFADFCAADIFFAPVAARFRTYGVVLEPPEQAYAQRLLDHPIAKDWFALGEAELTVIDQFELPTVPN